MAVNDTNSALGELVSLLHIGSDLDFQFGLNRPEARSVALAALVFGLVPAQDGSFFYTRSHLSALPNCAVLLSTNF